MNIMEIHLPPPEPGKPFHIKSKLPGKNGLPRSIGYLDVPKYDGTWKCDADLYAAVKKHGYAVVTVGALSSLLKPEQFEAKWQGD